MYLHIYIHMNIFFIKKIIKLTVLVLLHHIQWRKDWCTETHCGLGLWF